MGTSMEVQMICLERKTPTPIHTADLTLPQIVVQVMQLWLGCSSGGLQAHVHVHVHVHVPAGGDSATACPQGWGSQLHPRDNLLQSTKSHGHGSSTAHHHALLAGMLL